jgi:CheY-specific phosphatase CheX
MISNRARNSFDQMLILGIKASMGGASPETCEVEVVADPNSIRETNVVMLTVASFLFRMSVLVYFSSDDATRSHFAAVNNVDSAEMNDQAFLDAIRECGNICCGTLNRELARVYPHVAMSTPNIIERECVNHLESLNGGHLQHFRATPADGKQFHVSLCVRDYADIDFEWAMAEETTAAGEMEFF